VNAKDLKSKCSRAMLESGPNVEIQLTVPRPWHYAAGSGAVDLKLLPDGGPKAKVASECKVGGKDMLNVHIRAAKLLQALEQAAPDE
jgi:hypothetical protein